MTAGVLVVGTVLLSWSRPVDDVVVEDAAGAEVAAAAAGGWSGAVAFWRWPPAYTVMPARLSIVIPAAKLRRAFTELTRGERLRFVTVVVHHGRPGRA